MIKIVEWTNRLVIYAMLLNIFLYGLIKLIQKILSNIALILNKLDVINLHYVWVFLYLFFFYYKFYVVFNMF